MDLQWRDQRDQETSKLIPEDQVTILSGNTRTRHWNKSRIWPWASPKTRPEQRTRSRNNITSWIKVLEAKDNHTSRILVFMTTRQPLVGAPCHDLTSSSTSTVVLKGAGNRIFLLPQMIIPWWLAFLHWQLSSAQRHLKLHPSHTKPHDAATLGSITYIYWGFPQLCLWLGFWGFGIQFLIGRI